MEQRCVRRTSEERATRATSPRRATAALRRALLLVATALLTAACREKGPTDNSLPDVVGNFNLLTYNGANLPTIVASGFGYSESLLSARMELLGKTARDIKVRRISSSGTTTEVTDTVDLSVGRYDQATLLMRPVDAPSLQPDTAVVADGVVKEGLLTVRTRSGPTQPAGQRATLVYGRQS